MNENSDATPQKSRYLNLFSDRAFKAVFGSERNKEITQAFLNSILGEYGPIEELTFVKTDYAAQNPEDRCIAVDLQCRTRDGRRIVVELQKKRQPYFCERTLYYATWPIQAQGKRGAWNYDIDAVYVVSILDFAIDGTPDDTRIIRRKMILDTETQEPWTHKLVFFNLELARFDKRREECATQAEKWFFVLKNLQKLLNRPAEWQEEVFRHLFEVTDKTRFNESETQEYESSEAEYSNMKYALEYAISEGKALGIAEGKAEGKAEGNAEGREEEKLEIAKQMKADGLPAELICKYTGLDVESLQAL